jgi:hypothetical protein
MMATTISAQGTSTPAQHVGASHLRHDVRGREGQVGVRVAVPCHATVPPPPLAAPHLSAPPSSRNDEEDEGVGCRRREPGRGDVILRSCSCTVELPGPPAGEAGTPPPAAASAVGEKGRGVDRNGGDANGGF